MRYGRTPYVIEKFGEPTAAIISMEDFELLQMAKRQQSAASLKSVIANIRERGQQIESDELNALIEEARSEFYQQQSD